MKSLEERFWEKVDRRGADECWPWTAATSASGYGRISGGSRATGMLTASRVSYSIAHGSADGVHVRHTCDNPRCVNPRHLVAGTHADNMRDMAEHARSRTTRLTPAQVLEIRARAAESQTSLALEFGVSKSNIAMIVKQQTWKHLPSVEEMRSRVVIEEPLDLGDWDTNA